MSPFLLTPLLIPLAPPPPDAVWPLQPRPRIVRSYAPPAKPWLPGHRGVDLAGSPGQPVLSATPGTITYAGPVAGRSVVVVTQGPRRTTYEPVIPSLPTGTAVQRAQPIGRLSSVASHCAPATCLHWGLLQGETYLNPLELLPTQPVRLLPTIPPELPALPPATASGSPGKPASTSPPAAGPSAPAPHAAPEHGSLVPTAVVAVGALATLGAAVLVRNH